MICEKYSETRSKLAIVLVSYNYVYITWLIIGRLRYLSAWPQSCIYASLTYLRICTCIHVNIYYYRCSCYGSWCNS